MKRCAASILMMILIMSGVFEFQSRMVSAQQASLSFDGISDPAWGSVSDVSYSPDGRKIAVATETGVYVYDEYLQPEAHLNAHVGQVYSAEWRGDGSRLATGGEDATLRIWDMIETSPTYLDFIQVIQDDGPVYYVSWSPNINANTVATRTVTRREQSSDSIFIQADIKIWNLDSGQVERTFGNLTTGSREIIWNPDGSLLASAGANAGSGYRLWVWNVETGNLVATSERRLEQIRSITWKPNSNVVAISDLTGVIQLFDVVQSRTLNIIWSEFGSISDVDWEPTGTHLAMGSRFSRFQIYIANTAQTIIDIDTTPKIVTRLEWANAGDRIAVVLDYDTVRIYDVSNLPENTDVPTITPITPFPTDTLAATPTPTVPTVPAATTTTTTLLHEIQLGVTLYDAEWSPDGSLLAVATESGIRIFTSSLQFVTELQGHLSAVTAVAWSPDGTQLASGASYFDDGLRIWNYDAVTNTFTLDRVLLREGELEDSYETRALAWSPDGFQFADLSLSGYDGHYNVLSIYNASTWVKSTALPYVDQHLVPQMAWSPDGSRIALTGGNRELYKLIVVDVETLTLVYRQLLRNYGDIEISNPVLVSWNAQDEIVVPDGTELSVFEGATGIRISLLNTQLSFVGKGDWSHDENYLYLVNPSHLGIWEVHTQTRVARFDNVGVAAAIDWSAQDKVVVASPEGILQVIDVSQLPDLSGTATVTPIPTNTPYWTPTPTPRVFRSTATTPTATPTPTIQAATAYQDYGPASIPMVTPIPSSTLYVMPAATTYTIRAATASPTLTPATPLREIQLEGEITAVEWNADGSLLAVASGENIEIFDPSLQRVTQFKAHTGQVTTLTWNPDGTQLATGGREESAIKIWDYDAQSRTFGLIRTLLAKYNHIVSLKWSPDSAKFASLSATEWPRYEGDFVGEIEIWDTANWTVSNILPPFGNITSTLLWSPDSGKVGGRGDCFSTSEWQCPQSFQSGIYIFDATTAEFVGGIDLNRSIPGDADWHSNGQLLVTDSWVFRIFDIHFTRLASFEAIVEAWLIKWHPDGRRLAFTDSSFELALFDSKTARMYELHFGTFSAIDWHPEGQFLVSGTTEGKLQLFDVSGIWGDDSAVSRFPSATPSLTPTSTRR